MAKAANSTPVDFAGTEGCSHVYHTWESGKLQEKEAGDSRLHHLRLLLEEEPYPRRALMSSDEICIHDPRCTGHFKNIYLFILAASSQLPHVGFLLWCLGFSLIAACRLSFPRACGILVTRRGIKPWSPPLEVGFLTTEPPGKSFTGYS